MKNIEIIDTRENLIKLLPKNKKVLEIGVFKGDFSKYLHTQLEPEELFLNDIFTGRMGSGDKDGNNMIFVNLDDEYKNLLSFFDRYDNVKFLKGRSVDVLSNISDDYLDIVYIDGSHEYDDVKSDLMLSHIKVKNNGYICGHDYNLNRFPGVCKAVDEFCLEKGLHIVYLTKDGCPSYCIINKK